MNKEGIKITAIDSVQFEPHENGWGVRFTIQCLKCRKEKSLDFIDTNKVDDFTALLDKNIIPREAKCNCWTSIN